MDLNALFADAPPGAARLGVVGWPLESTFSPAMHNAACAHFSIPALYRALRVPPESLAEFCRQARALPLRGFNVTVPHKESLPGGMFLTPPPVSINTVVAGSGLWRGVSTDGAGFLASLAEEGIPIDGKRVVILGAGGAARAIALSLGTRPAAITVVNRTRAKADGVVDAVRAQTGHPRLAAAGGEDPRAVREADLIVQCTSLGLRADDALPVDPRFLRAGQSVYDLIYHRDTALLRAARERGARAVGGLGMLVHQGALAFELWFEEELKKVKYSSLELRNIMRAAAARALKERPA